VDRKESHREIALHDGWEFLTGDKPRIFLCPTKPLTEGAPLLALFEKWPYQTASESPPDFAPHTYALSAFSTHLHCDGHHRHTIPLHETLVPREVLGINDLRHPPAKSLIHNDITRNSFRTRYLERGLFVTYGREFVDNGNTAANHYYTNPVYGGGNHFSDMPTAPNGGSFKGVVLAGSADVKNKTFTTQAAFAYGFSASKSGKLSVMTPRAATKAERAHSLATIRAASRTWTIN